MKPGGPAEISRQYWSGRAWPPHETEKAIGSLVETFGEGSIDIGPNSVIMVSGNHVRE